MAQLETALRSRVVIEQAKGVLAERLAISVREAFTILRYAARSHRTKLHELAAQLVEERKTPAAVTVAFTRMQRERAVWMREVTDAQRAHIEELRAAFEAEAEPGRAPHTHTETNQPGA